jgi:hypothetical protein
MAAAADGDGANLVGFSSSEIGEMEEEEEEEEEVK